MPPAIYDQSTIQRLGWPATPDGDYAQRYLLPFLEHGPQRYIANVHTDLRLLAVDDVILPVTVTQYHPENSYVCSPYNHYFAYGEEEMEKLGHLMLAALFRLLLRPVAGYFLRCGFDEVVLVNNWLLSTNLYPALTAQQVQAATHFLAAEFPERPIVWRSVDDTGNPALLRTLGKLGCVQVFSRQVYYQNPGDASLWRRKQIKVDQSLARRSAYTLSNDSTLTAMDVPRLAELYRMLYLKKYSYFNPQFTDDFFRLALNNRLLVFKTYQAPASAAGRGAGRVSPHNTPRKTQQPYQKLGDIDAVLGYFMRNGIRTQPIFGYDTGKPPKAGLYRLLSLHVLEEAHRLGLRVNASGGVGDFKRLRGGVASLEYNAVYLDHLPARRQRPWRWLKRLLDTVAVPIIQKYGF